MINPDEGIQIMKLRIEQDQDAQSPQEDTDNGLYLIANHRDFFVPPSPKERNFDVQEHIDAKKKTHHVFLLEAYIHSGVRLALAGEGNFCDRQWDVSLLLKYAEENAFCPTI